MVVLVLEVVVMMVVGRVKQKKKKDVSELPYRGVGNTCSDRGERRQATELPLPLQSVAHQPNK